MSNFWQNPETEKTFRALKPSLYITQELDQLFANQQINTVLDLGCGAGRYVKYLKKYITPIYATDLYDNMSKNINKTEVIYKNADMANIPFHKRYDLILSIGVLHNANNKKHLEKTIKSISSHLKENGFLICSIFTNKLITDDLTPEKNARFLVADREPMVLLSEQELDCLFKKYNIIKIKELDTHITDVGSGKRFVYTALYKRDSVNFLKDYSFNQKPNCINMVLSSKFLAKRRLPSNIESTLLDSYPDEKLSESLLEKISTKYQLNTKNIVLGAAANGIIQNLIKLFFCHGGTLLTTEYSFPQPQVAVTRIGGFVRKIQHKDDLHIDFEKLALAITPFTKAIFLCNPNNPTGFYENPKDILSFAAKVSVPVIVSEAAIEFTKKQSLLDFYKVWPPNLIVVRTFSKAFGLAGLRIGFGVMKKFFFDYYRKNITRFEVSILSILYATYMLNDDSVAENVEKIIYERNYLASELSKLGIETFISDSNTLMSKKKWPKSFFNTLFDSKIAVSIIDDFSSNHYFRIAIQDHKTNVRFIRKLKQINIRKFLV